ncbi:MAG: TlpA family protein disulfide reductase [Acidobacteria bacterium]|nr:TlpA family protein disulfide reductase [Acidobacteriota bacterium]
MPPFRLSDIDGNVWNLKRLQGKTLLVAVWASWSAPCQILMPKVQALFDQLKPRQEIIVATFNVDEETATIRPYLEKHGFTFPVVPSRVFVGQLVGFLSVPRFWIIDANGKWQWEQVGFDVNDKEWETELLKRLEGAVAASA